MQGLFDLPPDLRAAADASLQAGEHAEWAGRGSPSRAFYSVIGLWLFALPWTAVSLLFFAAALAALLGIAEIEGAEGPMAWFFLLFSLPFVAIGAALLSAPFWAARDARRSVFLVTDRRVLKVCAEGGRSVKALAAAALRGVEAKIGHDGRGRVKALGPVGKDSDGDRVTDEIDMNGVADAAGAEAALWRLIESARAQNGKTMS
jgi:rhodanese-related sulfurtransferase